MLIHPGQPLLRLKQSHNPHNLLVNFNDGGWLLLELLTLFSSTNLLKPSQTPQPTTTRTATANTPAPPLQKKKEKIQEKWMLLLDDLVDFLFFL